jgi:hypothetical protein
MNDETIIALRELLTRLDERVGNLLRVQEDLLTKLEKSVTSMQHLAERVSILETGHKQTSSLVEKALDSGWKIAVAVVSGILLWKIHT